MANCPSRAASTPGLPASTPRLPGDVALLEHVGGGSGGESAAEDTNARLANFHDQVSILFMDGELGGLLTEPWISGKCHVKGCVGNWDMAAGRQHSQHVQGCQV